MKNGRISIKIMHQNKKNAPMINILPLDILQMKSFNELQLLTFHILFLSFKKPQEFCCCVDMLKLEIQFEYENCQLSDQKKFIEPF